MHSQQPIGVLNPNLDNKIFTPTTVVTDHNLNKNKLLQLLLWLVIIAVIVYILLMLTKPAFVRKTTSTVDGVTTTEIDQTKAIITSLIVAVIIVLILYLLKVIR